MIQLDSDTITDAEAAALAAIVIADRTILARVQRVAVIKGAIYILGKTVPQWWKFNPTSGPVWTKVADPTVVVPPPPPVFAPPDIMDLDFTSEAELRSWTGIMAGNAGPNQISANRAPEWLVDTNTPSGKPINCLRAGGDPANSMRIFNWFFNLGEPNAKLAAFAPVDELFARSCYFIETDCTVGIDRRSLGMKLSGLSMSYPGLWPSAIGEIDVTELPGNTTDAPFRGYGYWAEGDQLLQPSSGRARFARWFCVEQHLKFNTLGQSDGVLEYWLDDVPVYSRGGINFRGNNAAAKIGCMQGQCYVGGATYLFTQPVHVRVAKFAMSTQRIGRPPELMAA